MVCVCVWEGEKGDVCNVLARPVMDDTLINRSIYVHVCMGICWMLLSNQIFDLK